MASSALPLPLSPSSPPTSNAPPIPVDHLTTHILSPIPNSKTPSIRSRLSKLCQEGQLLRARQLFDTIPRPTTILWNTIIIGFVCNNMPHDALLFYSKMKSSSNTISDSYTYSSVLKACADTRNLMLGKAVHCHFLRSQLNPSRIVYNSLLNMYSVCLSSTNYEMGTSLMCSYDAQYDSVCKVFDTMRKRNVVAWNTVIGWYVRIERYVEAIKQFRIMMKVGIKPSAISFVNVFPAFSSMGDFHYANVLYGMLVRLGSEYVNDLFVVSSAIFMYAELGCLEFSRKIFNNCSERNTEIWNTMISAYVQNNCPLEGINLFHQAIQSGEADLDDVTFLSALAAVSHLQDFELAQQLHAFITKNLKVLPVIIINAIIVMYSRCDSIETSFKIFHTMPERDIVSWNTMVSAFVQNGLDDEALMLVYEMQKQGFTIDSVTVTALLSAASNLRNPDIGKPIHAYLIRNRIQFDGIDNYLIDMYAKSGLVRAAKNLFDKSYNYARDQATWNAMIAGYTQNGLVEEAFLVFRQMVEQKVIPNAVTLAPIIPACNPNGCIDWGRQLHGFSVRHYLDQNVFVGTALIDMYSKCGAITYAENVFGETEEKNRVTYTTMIMGYGQHGLGERAVSLFYKMQEYGLKPDAITIIAVLSACNYAAMVDEGLQIFNSMINIYNINPSTEHYCCIVDMLGRVGRVGEAYEFVKGLGEEGNVMEIWGSLLGACKIHRQFELGKLVAEKLLEMERGNHMPGYHVLLSNIYAEEGNWENVNRVREQMKEKGLRKETGCSWIETSGFVNRFVSKDQKHAQRDQIYHMLRDLVMEMKRVDYK